MSGPLKLIAGLALALVVPALCLVLVIRAAFTDYEYTLATLDCGPGRQVVLSTWSLHEGRADLSYRVIVDGHEVVPPYPTGMQDEYFWEGGVVGFDRLHFTTIASRDGQLVGIVAEEFPYSVVAVHDFSTGESWPYGLRDHGNMVGQGRGSYYQGRRRMQSLRERLEAEHPQVARAAKTADRAYLDGREDLDLSYSRAGDAELAQLAGLPHLKTLRLEGTEVTDRGLANLKVLPALRVLFLSHTAISDDGLASLAAVRTLEQVTLSETNVTDRGLQHLAEAQGLRDIWLQGTKVTKEGVTRLRQSLPRAGIWWED